MRSTLDSRTNLKKLSTHLKNRCDSNLRDITDHFFTIMEVRSDAIELGVHDVELSVTLDLAWDVVMETLGLAAMDRSGMTHN